MLHVSSFPQLVQFIRAFQGKALFIKAGAEWCGPCKRIQPYFSQLAEFYETTYAGQVAFLTYDHDEANQISTHFQVQSLPTFLCLLETDCPRLNGANPQQLDNWIKMCLQSIVLE